MENPAQILFVDDEKNVLKALQRLFMDDEYELFTANSGPEGLDILRQESGIQLVVTDYRMPQMNGVDFLQEVSKHWPETVRIVLSGFADTAAVVSAINEGQVYRFVGKPWNDEDLRQTIRQALHHYQLQRKNELLLQQLKNTNEELQSVNDNLELLVKERTANLVLRNQALLIAQNILDAMPTAVMGIDSCKMVVYANHMGRHLFTPPHDLLLGAQIDEVLPQNLLPLVAGAARGDTISEQTVIQDRPMRILGSKLRAQDQEGVILIAIPEI
ncbi:MAG: response regulator [Desulfuromonadaceae bacterium]|jgi:two-component system, NtrC family, sensor kinase